MKYLFLMVFFASTLRAQCPPCSNQTSFFTSPLSEEGLPFRIKIEEADISLTAGLQSFAFGTYNGEWLFLSGRTNGLHNVDNEDPSDNSFPVSKQNVMIYVFNPTTGITLARSLYDSKASLTQPEIDQLSVTNTIFYQTRDKKTLYVVGGYGTNTATGQMETKDAITAIDVPKLIQWVKNSSKGTARDCMRFAYHPLLRVTGGELCQANPHQPYLLVFGQNFQGFYLQTSEGTYPRQVRPCQILDNGKDLLIQPYNLAPPLAEFRRRDLNVIPIIKKTGKYYTPSFVALSGVFTPGGETDTPGAWTAPIAIAPDGSAVMHDPDQFSQAMNNYACPSIGLYSQKKDNMYTLLFGGISAVIGISTGDCSSECQAPIPSRGSNYTQCCNLPFVNDITTVKIDKHGNYFQYLMSARYPTIDSGLTQDPCTDDPLTDPRILYFGASAEFIPNENLTRYSNGVIAFDKLGSSDILLGYIVGGIASSLTDTNCFGDSTASGRIFRVTLRRVD